MSAADALRVRAALPADAGAVAPLLAELGYPIAAAQVRSNLERLGRGGADRVLVAVRDGAPLGVLALHVIPLLHDARDVAWITALVVTERARGAGVGQALVAAAEEAARALGCVRIAVTSAERRADAHAFYARLGYAHTGRRFVKALEPPGA